MRTRTGTTETPTKPEIKEEVAQAAAADRVPAPEVVAPKAEAPSVPLTGVDELRSRIKKQGKIELGVPQFRRPVAAAGLYRVTHGRVCLGHVDGETVYAEPGAEVMLTAEEAGRMLAEKSVEKIAA